jgi:hypothetical protein
MAWVEHVCNVCAPLGVDDPNVDAYWFDPCANVINGECVGDEPESVTCYGCGRECEAPTEAVAFYPDYSKVACDVSREALERKDWYPCKKAEDWRECDVWSHARVDGVVYHGNWTSTISDKHAVIDGEKVKVEHLLHQGDTK